jgi:glucose-1-phosphate cytidylyltransferase
MVTIGARPILWHIMKHYSVYGLNDFVIALGYKGEYIKKYFVDYCSLESNLTVNVASGKVKRHSKHNVNWNVDLIDTGVSTLTGGRLKRLGDFLGGETFMLTWSDGVSNVDLIKLLEFHKSHGKLATVTAVRPTARFGHMVFDGDQVVEFSEKPQAASGWINGAFFVLEPKVLDYIDGDTTQWEREPMERLSQDGQLMAYRHTDFWQCMDTLRDRVLLEALWEKSDAPWKTWSD